MCFVSSLELVLDFLLMGNVLDCLKRKKQKQKEGLVDIIMGPAYYNILKYQRSLIWHEGGNPAVRARHFGLALLGERVFCRPGFAWDFLVWTHSLASHQAVRRSFLKLVSSLCKDCSCLYGSKMPSS
jgi:hypothetical protein